MRLPQPLATIVLCAGLLLVSAAAQAHEFYLQPDSYTAKAGEPLAVRHHVGTRFNGNELPWITNWNVRSEMWQGGAKTDVSGTDGDRPTLTVTPQADGLLTLAHQSNHSTYAPATWEKFETYLRKEGLGDIVALHEARDLGDRPPKEAYSRFAKSLVAIGDGAGSDDPVGLKIELVALENPYTFPVDQPLPVQVLFDGKPLAGVTVKVFDGVDTEAVDHIITDANGQVMIPPGGPGPYLLNAIHMIEPVSQTKIAQAADWESFWASLTFQRGLE